MTTAMFRQFAAYNRWANGRLYGFALALPEAVYRRPTGAFFKSLHGTLNHILVADRIWLRRLTGHGDAPDRLDAVIHDDRDELARARAREDERLIRVVADCNDADLDRMQAYQTTSGQQHEQRLADILQHLFNHQTHHRGQAHACCSILTGQEPPSLDLIVFQRAASTPSRSDGGPISGTS